MPDKDKEEVGGKSIYVENAEDREETRKMLAEKRKQALKKLKLITGKLKKQKKKKKTKEEIGGR
jgi:hypothetical protein